MKFAIDTNVLVYAFLKGDDRKHHIAADVMIRAMLLDCVLPVQVLAEFLNVVRRSGPKLFTEASEQVARWCDTIQVVETGSELVMKGAAFAAKHKLQLWDSIIWQAARSAHAVLLLSEDLQDNLSINGMRVLNPFNPANELELNKLLSSADLEIDW